MMKDGAHGNGEGCIAGITMVARLFWRRSRARGLAVGTHGLPLPAHAFYMSDAVCFGRIKAVNLNDVHVESLPSAR
jgi:hypothetical protein